MADRYEKSFTRKPNPADPASSRSPSSDDPLAELARIVSGNQSFDDLVGRPAAPPQPAPRQAAPAAPAQRAPSRDFSFDLESELLNDLQSSFDPNARVAPPRAQEPRMQEQPRMQEPPLRQTPPAAPPRQAQAFDDMRLRGAAPPPPQQPAQPANWGASRAPAPAEEDPYAGTAYSSGDYDRPAADPFAAKRPAAPVRAPVAPPAPEPAAAGGYDDDYYYDEAAEQPYDEGDYSEENFSEYDGYGAQPPRRSRKLLIGAAIVLAVLLAGGLVALALKDNGTLTTASAPQVIDADPNPTKVQPAVQPTDSDGQQNKVIFDRANPDTAPQEQLVLPDDGAVDSAPASNESAGSREISRIILPGAPGDNSTEPAVPGDSSGATDQSADGDSVPRKVRTVVIKPDGTIVSSQARAKGAPDTAPDAAAAPAADSAPATAAAPAPAPAADSGAVAAAPEPILPDVVPPTPAREPSAQVAEAPAASSAAPVKDNSQLEPPAAAPAPKAAARPAATQAAPSSGGFVVQVTSQRSEEQAVAAFRALQRKYPDVLGNRSPDIARADLGAKGVYYRVRIGPTATRDESISLCEALKAAGGDCIVQKN